MNITGAFSEQNMNEPQLQNQMKSDVSEDPCKRKY